VSFSRRFFRDMWDRLPIPGAIVLDNCQDATDDAQFRAVLTTLIAEAVPGITVIFISRDRPPGDFAHLVANRQIAILGWEALQLTPHESLAIAQMRAPISEAAASQLHLRCDGWVAGLMLLLARKDKSDYGLGTFEHQSREATFDYFAHQVFEQSASDVQRLLMDISVLPFVTPTFADALTENSGSGRLLDALYRRNLFIQRRPGNEPTYQLHALFREFLIARAAAVLSPSERSRIKTRAAELLEDVGLTGDALVLFFEAEEFERASRVILSRAQALFSEGRWRTLREWILRLPGTCSEADPWVGYWLGLTEFQLDQTLSRQTLSRAYDAFTARNDRIGQMLSAASILTGYYFEYVDWTPADLWIERLAALIDDGPSLPSPELELTVYSAMLYGIAIRQTDHPMLSLCIDRTMNILRKRIDTNARLLGGLAITGPVCCMLGAFDLFKEATDLLAPLVTNPEVTELHRAAWFMTTGCKRYMNCENEAAYRDLEEGARLSRIAGLRQIEFLSLCFHAFHSVNFLELASAERALDEARRVADTSRPLERTYLLWAESQVEGLRGNHESALGLARTAQQVAESIGSPAHRLIGWTLQGAPLVLSGKLDEAEALASEGLRFGAARRVRTWDAVFLMMIAWSRLERGDIPGARRHVTEALRSGQDGTASYLRWLLTGNRRMLEFALREGIDVANVRGLIRQFRYPPADVQLEQWPWPIRIYALGRFEVLVDDQPLVFGRKVPRKPLALLQYIIASGGEHVSDQRVADALWPDAEGDEAVGSIRLALHRLRELLRDHDAVRLQGARFSLNPDRVWVDALSLAKSVTAEKPVNWGLYAGDFLASEREEGWMLPFREKLRRLHATRAGRPSGSMTEHSKRPENDSIPPLA